MNATSPAEVLDRVARAVPSPYHGNLVVIGSLAAGYELLARDRVSVRTKDIDCVLSPRVTATASGRAIAEALLDAGWRQREGAHSRPGNTATPDDLLPAIRLHPPDSTDWFIELLTLPDPAQTGRAWTRVELPAGHFGLPSFRFLPISTFQPLPTPFGIHCARVEMMALGNLLEHPRIAPQVIEGSIFEGRAIKRSNKDLGRVLAIARLSEGRAMDSWPAGWKEALESCFPEEGRNLARHAGVGLRELLSSPEDLRQAHHSSVVGLLAFVPVTMDQLRFTGLRLVQDVVEPFEVLGESSR